VHTFHLPPADWGEPFALFGDEARHLDKVLRLGPGAEVRCFDAEGRAGLFRVAAISRRSVELVPLKLWEVPLPASAAVLAVGWTRQARRGWLLEKAVELGAAGLAFWQAARSQGRVPEAVKPSWTASLLAGAKQSGNLRPPVLSTLPEGLSGVVGLGRSCERSYVLDPAAPPLPAAEAARPGRTLFVLGPEGGLTPEETDALKAAGFTPASLGQGVLRWETAALACLALHLWARSGREVGA